MTKNIHVIERVIRIALGLVMIPFAFVGTANLWFLIGIVPLATGLVGWCPAYTLLGINTCNLGRQKTAPK